MIKSRIPRKDYFKIMILGLKYKAVTLEYIFLIVIFPVIYWIDEYGAWNYALKLDSKEEEIWDQIEAFREKYPFLR